MPQWKCSHYATATTSLTPAQSIMSKNKSQSQIAQYERTFDPVKTSSFQHERQVCDADTLLKDRVVQRDTGLWIPVMTKAGGASVLEFWSSRPSAQQIIIFYVRRVRILRALL